MVSTSGDAIGPWQRWAAAWLRRDRSLAYPVLLALAAIDSAGYSVIAPTLPTLAERYDAGPALIGALGIMLAILATGALDGILPLHFAERLSQTASA